MMSHITFEFIYLVGDQWVKFWGNITKLNIKKKIKKLNYNKYKKKYVQQKLSTIIILIKLI